MRRVCMRETLVLKFEFIMRGRADQANEQCNGSAQRLPFSPKSGARKKAWELFVRKSRSTRRGRPHSPAPPRNQARTPLPDMTQSHTIFLYPDAKEGMPRPITRAQWIFLGSGTDTQRQSLKLLLREWDEYGKSGKPGAKQQRREWLDALSADGEVARIKADLQATAAAAAAAAALAAEKAIAAAAQEAAAEEARVQRLECRACTMGVSIFEGCSLPPRRPPAPSWRAPKRVCRPQEPQRCRAAILRDAQAAARQATDGAMPPLPQTHTHVQTCRKKPQGKSGCRMARPYVLVAPAVVAVDDHQLQANICQLLDREYGSMMD